MEVITGGVVFIAIAVVALVLGIAVDRFLLARVGQTQLTQAKAQAERLLSDAQRDVETLRYEKIDKAEAELARREQALAQETAEAKRGLRRSREKQEQRQDKLNHRTQRVNEREKALHSAAEVLESLKAEAKYLEENGKKSGVTTTASGLQ